MHCRKETRADGLLEELTEPARQTSLQKSMAESMNLSALTARLNGLSQQYKNTPVSAEHLTALAEFLMGILHEFQNRVLSELEDLKKSQRHGL
jgi:hypothetical protein